MAIDKKAVEYTAHLARIELKDKELETLSGQLDNILEFINQLKKADVQGVDATSYILPINNVLRDDIVKPSLPVEDVLKNAPSRQGSFFSVPKIIE